MPDPKIQGAVIRHAQADMANIGPDIPRPKPPPAPKIGAEHGMGMLRLGAHELTGALQAFPDSNIRPMEEPGVFGNENAPHIVNEPSYESELQAFAQRGMSNDNDRSRTR